MKSFMHRLCLSLLCTALFASLGMACTLDEARAILAQSQPSVDAKMVQMNEALSEYFAKDAYGRAMDSFYKVQNFTDRKLYMQAHDALMAFFSESDVAVAQANVALKAHALALFKDDVLILRAEAAAAAAKGNTAVVVAPKVTPPSPPAATYHVYVVKEGESLWSISEKQFGKGELWYRLFLLNEGKVENPRLIFPAQEIKLPSNQSQLPKPKPNIPPVNAA